MPSLQLQREIIPGPNQVWWAQNMQAFICVLQVNEPITITDAPLLWSTTLILGKSAVNTFIQKRLPFFKFHYDTIWYQKWQVSLYYHGNWDWAKVTRREGTEWYRIRQVVFRFW